MSDITKKIFSIEPEGDIPHREPNASDIIRPISVSPEPVAVKVSGAKKGDLKTEKVPEFVTRDKVTPLSTPPITYNEDISSGSGWIIWTVIGFSLLYVSGVSFFLLPSLVKETGTLFQYGGLVVLLVLPVILLILLGVALRKLSKLSHQSHALIRAADLLVSPETEALGRTQTLARGIQVEISKLNTQLTDTVTALKGVQTAVTQESEALDTAGLKLSSRSDDVGRNLTLQRQALESVSDTFDKNMGSLAAKIAETSSGLEALCADAEVRLTRAGVSLTEATATTGINIEKSTDLIDAKISELSDVSVKLNHASSSFNSDLTDSAKQLVEIDVKLEQRTSEFGILNNSAQMKISDLQATVANGNELLTHMRTAADLREKEINGLYDRLFTQLKKSEDDTLASQGKTARIVEANLAQMRRDFGRMETELQTLQIKLNGLRDAADAMPVPDLEPSFLPSRLNLKPLDTDFPPVEPPRSVSNVETQQASIDDAPLNLGMDMEIESSLSEITNFNPDVIMRPGQPTAPKKGFGRKTAKEPSGWRWRDMLGGLERPDLDVEQPTDLLSAPVYMMTDDQPEVDIVARLSAIQLAPSAFVDEGTVIDATQARINDGESGLAAAVAKQLPDAVTHLQEHIAADPDLAEDVKRFHDVFSKTMGNTPPSAPALRAALGSPDGRAYLLCTAALNG